MSILESLYLGNYSENVVNTFTINVKLTDG